jgi:dTDP-4-amino-4,6-dideoxygalactose transaminase
MIVPFLDLKAGYLELKDELDHAYHRVMDSGWYILGDEVDVFERAFARYCSTKYCIGVSSGLDALVLILRAYGIGVGDEVIVPSNTYIATWLAVSQVGATPVPVEPDIDTCNIDLKKIEAALSSRTKAIIPVHLYGQPADMQPIMVLAEKYQLCVIEDAAQSQGAKYKQNRTGCLGHAAAFSFYPAKNLGAFGDAGAITTDDSALADKIHLLRNYGSRRKYQNEIKGGNNRIDPLQAAFLAVKLRYLDEWNMRRRKIAGTYLDSLASIPQLKLPKVANAVTPVWHQFAVRVPDRDIQRSKLEELGVETGVHYPVPPHLSEAYISDRHWGDLPIAEEISATTLSLPIGPQVTEHQIDYVCDAVATCFNN